MKRLQRSRDNWGEDAEHEFSIDREMAEEFGFEAEEITAARSDLVTLLFAYCENSFSEFELAAQGLERLCAKLDNRASELNELALRTNIADIGNAADDLSNIIERLKLIRTKLPHRPHSFQSIAVTFLMACWVHSPRKAGYVGTREIVVSFNGPDPSHPSMCYIIKMLARPKHALLLGIGKTTIGRVYNAIKANIPLPGAVYASEGDPRYYS